MTAIELPQPIRRGVRSFVCARKGVNPRIQGANIVAQAAPSWSNTERLHRALVDDELAANAEIVGGLGYRQKALHSIPQPLHRAVRGGAKLS
jgi:hypothetical protein